MLRRVRQALLVSAAARNLAVDMVGEHGVAALALIERECRCAKDGSVDERILSAARRHVVALVAVLQDRQHAGRADVDVGRLSKRSR